MKNEPTGHPFLCFIYDMLVIGIFLSIIQFFGIYFLEARQHENIEALLIALAPVFFVFKTLAVALIVAAFIYHSYVKYRVAFLSPGERLAGVEVRQGKKYWPSGSDRLDWMYHLGALLSLLGALYISYCSHFIESAPLPSLARVILSVCCLTVMLVKTPKAGNEILPLIAADVLLAPLFLFLGVGTSTAPNEIDTVFLRVLFGLIILLHIILIILRGIAKKYRQANIVSYNPMEKYSYLKFFLILLVPALAVVMFIMLV